MTKTSSQVTLAVAATLALAFASHTTAQEAVVTTEPQTIGPVHNTDFHTQYLRLGDQSDGLLYEPNILKHPGIAVIFTHPDRNNFNAPVGREMAMRGYRALMVNYHGDDDFGEANPEEYLPGIADAVRYLRTLAGVKKVILIGHSGGGHLVGLYGGVSQNGAAFCADRRRLYPCRTKNIEHLAKIDGIVFLDSTLGAFHAMSGIDPAVTDKGRDPALDMFSGANGFDTARKSARYTATFEKKFYAAQAARNAGIVSDALSRLRAIEQGRGNYSDDEPLLIKGMGVRAAGARLYQPDPDLAAHTRNSHLLLRADGTNVETVIHSVRPPNGRSAGAIDSLEKMTQDTTVRRFLSASAIRTLPDYAITADDIVGVDWDSAYNSTPAMAEGIVVPALVMTMSCHYLIVPGEIIFDHLASTDKTYASVEGATHGFKACQAQYGNTTKRTFDFLDRWLSQGRFN